jgi:hypothetical protein
MKEAINKGNTVCGLTMYLHHTYDPPHTPRIGSYKRERSKNPIGRPLKKKLTNSIECNDL